MEKEWFVYVGDHHEGPFTVEDVKQKLSSGVITHENYLWCDGMADWKLLKELPQFGSDHAPAAADSEVKLDLDVPMQVPAEQGPTLTKEAASEESPGFKLETPDEPTFSGLRAVLPDPEPAEIPAEATPISAIRERPAEEQFSEITKDLFKEQKNKFRKVNMEIRGGKKRSLIKWIVILAIFAGGGYGYYSGELQKHVPVQDWIAKVAPLVQSGLGVVRPLFDQVVSRVPFLADWLSPITKPQDLGEAEFKELLGIARSNPKVTPQVGFGLALNGLERPSVYLATNVPGEIQFSVAAVSIEGTLVNAFDFFAKTQAKVGSKLARSSALQSADGRVLPRGFYNVYVYETLEQNPQAASQLASLAASNVMLPKGFPGGKKLVATKQLFLGGKKDPTYENELASFHQKVSDRSLKELTEVKEFARSILTQMTQHDQEYRKIKGKRLNSAQSKKWKEFNSKWERFFGQLSQNFQKWDPEILRSRYFHGVLYDAIKRAGNSLAILQRARLAASSDVATLEAGFQKDYAILDQAIKATEALGTLPNGMPRRLSWGGDPQ